MIKDNLKNAKKYYKLSDNLKKGLVWLQKSDLKSMEDGKYIIDGEKVFANIQTYTTKDDAPYERHLKYIDIQCMILGKEIVGVTNYKNCSSIENYNQEKDIEFLTNNVADNFHILQEGEFVVFFPQDAHKPALKFNQNQIVKKVVVKVGI